MFDKLAVAVESVLPGQRALGLHFAGEHPLAQGVVLVGDDGRFNVLDAGP